MLLLVFVLFLAVTATALPEGMQQVKEMASKALEPATKDMVITLESTTRAPGCYGNQNQLDPFPGCECHPSCSTCGYYDNPVQYNDCIACSNSTHVVKPHYGDGTGSCIVMDLATASGCYASPGEPIPDCTCHKSCKACGFSEDPTSYTNCLSCTMRNTPVVKDFHYPESFTFEDFDMGHCITVPDNLAMYEIVLEQAKDIAELKSKVLRLENKKPTAKNKPTTKPKPTTKTKPRTKT